MQGSRIGKTVLLAGLWLAWGAGAHAQTYSRTEVIVYHDNTTKWVLGQTASVTCTVSVPASTACDGDVVSSATFDATTAQQLTSSSFGKLQQTLTYNADGTLATVKDGNNNVTTLSNWKRGIPQNIQYPATPESPSGATESAIVNDNGWITSVTDENGYVTGYGYDAMGRLASIVYPTGDSVAWNTTTQVFEPVATAEYGIAAGHWRQTITTGNGKKITYYDALWRPLLTQEYDTANVAGTQRFQRFAYDPDGRTTFASYPGTTDALSTGNWTAYDSLGRVTSVSQDTELSPSLQVTTTAYLTGFQTRVTDPKGNQTTTSYQAYDQPTTDMPVAITHPEGAYTDIARDPFGKPTSIRRRNGGNSVSVTRSYIYDGAQQLCKSVEPETGTTIMDYDGAGNLSWQAVGVQGYADPSYCNYSEGWNSGHVVSRTYDARNRLAQLYFPDGRGNQTWTYTPDGLPSQITTYNDASNGAAVVNSYVYNKRRLLNGENSQQPGWYTWGLWYTYTPNGHLASQFYPAGFEVTYSPNALGQPTHVADTGGQIYASGISYYPNGSIKQFTYGNGIVHTMTQNARQLPSRVTDAGAVDYTYAYDANANPVTIRDVNAVNGAYSGNRDLSYDGLDRLTYAHLHWWLIDNWQYDALDNIATHSHYDGGSTTDNIYVYDANNRLGNIKNGAGATIVGLGYDVQGNLQNKNGQSYIFDYGNRLRETPGKEWYRYDGYGRRVLTWRYSEPGIVSMYSQSGQLLYDENHRSSGRTYNDYFYLAGSLIAKRERSMDTGAATIKYQHTDALGSPVAVTNTTGAVIDRTDYEPYGGTINKPAYDGVGFTGHVQDGATGLTYMQQRYYDPIIGRFLSVDPVTAYSNPVGAFNRYWYANNNPYKFADPDGRQSRDLEAISREAGVSPATAPLKSSADWLHEPLGYALGGVLLAPAAGFAGPGLSTAAADFAMGDALGGASLATGSTTLFRVVDNLEMKSIEEFGKFLPAPNGDTVKRFLNNLPDAKALAQKFSQVFGGEQHVVQGQASEAAMDAATVTRFSDVPGRPMDSVNVPNEQLQNVKCTGRVDGC